MQTPAQKPCRAPQPSRSPATPPHGPTHSAARPAGKLPQASAPTPLGTALGRQAREGRQMGGERAQPDHASPSLRNSGRPATPGSQPRAQGSRDGAPAGPVSRPPPLPQAVRAAAPPLAAGRAPSRSPQAATPADRGPRYLLAGGGPGDACHVREVEEPGSLPVLSSALPCSAGDGPPSCMLTVLRHFRKWLGPGGCPASSSLAAVLWSFFSGTLCRCGR